MNIINQDLDAFGLFLHALSDLIEIVKYGDKNNLEVRAPEIVHRNRVINSLDWFFNRNDPCSEDVYDIVQQALTSGIPNNFDFTEKRQELLNELIVTDGTVNSFEYDRVNKLFKVSTKDGDLIVPIEVGYIKSMSYSNKILRDMFYTDVMAKHNLFCGNSNPVTATMSHVIDMPEYSIIKSSKNL